MAGSSLLGRQSRTATGLRLLSCKMRRTQEEIQRSMNLKDVMRESCIKQLTDACISLVASLHAGNPDLAAAVLDAVSRYVNWIDIGLVANDRCVHSSAFGSRL